MKCVFSTSFSIAICRIILYRIVSYCDVVVVFDRISHAINRIGNGSDFIEIFVFIAACLIYLKFEIDTRTAYSTDQAQCCCYWSLASFFLLLYHQKSIAVFVSVRFFKWKSIQSCGIEPRLLILIILAKIRLEI